MTRLLGDPEVMKFYPRPRDRSEALDVGGRVDIEVGYHVHAHLQGLGYATEAATVCRDHARDAFVG